MRMIEPSVRHTGKGQRFAEHGLPWQQNYYLSAGELVEAYIVISVAPSRQVMESRNAMGRPFGSAIVESLHACQNAGCPQTSAGVHQPSSSFLNPQEIFRIGFHPTKAFTTVKTT